MEIPEILKQLEFNRDAKLAVEAIRAAQERRDEIIPHLLEIVRHAAADLEGVIVGDYIADLYAMTLLGEFREPKAYPEIVNLFTRPGQSSLAAELTGDVVSEHLGRILASVCAGDTSLIKQMIENPENDEFVRWAGLIALLTLMANGQLSRDELVAYFRFLFANLEREPSDVWTGLVDSCLQIWPGDLEDEIATALKEYLADNSVTDVETISEASRGGLEKAMAAFGKDRNYTLIGDTVAELERWDCFNERPLSKELPVFAPDEPRRRMGGTEPIPRLEPVKPIVSKPKVGRNDPCPCGSGKKFKKCCGG